MLFTPFQFLLLIVGLTTTTATSIQEKKCQISIDLSKGDLVEPQPLILTDEKNPSFLLPSEQNTLTIDSNTSILLACPGANNSFDNFETTRVLKARCLIEQQFSVDSNIYLFNNFKCKRLPESMIKEDSFYCLGKHTKYEIGFEVDKHFLKLYEVCRDEINYRTYYSKHILRKEIYGKQIRYPRTEWKSGGNYPRFDIENGYKFNSERETLAILLGSEELARKYIYVEENNWQMFQRGHLTPKTDFIYGPQQWTTFWLLNANPQWGSFNSGNWRILENSVRDFAILRQLDLIVYTGVHGITTLKDINNNEQLLYLHVNDTEKFVPVPRFFWKIIHDPISDRATAFIGLNEPFVDEISEDMYLCPDISNDYDFSWLTWKPKDIYLGVAYICTVESLREAVPTIPEIEDTDVLV